MAGPEPLLQIAAQCPEAVVSYLQKRSSQLPLSLSLSFSSSVVLSPSNSSV